MMQPFDTAFGTGSHMGADRLFNVGGTAPGPL